VPYSVKQLLFRTFLLSLCAVCRCTVDRVLAGMCLERVVRGVVGVEIGVYEMWLEQ